MTLIKIKRKSSPVLRVRKHPSLEKQAIHHEVRAGSMGRQLRGTENELGQGLTFFRRSGERGGGGSGRNRANESWDWRLFQS